MLIYPPSEDSFLMSRILKEKIPELLKKNPDLKFLEIGAGSGIQAQVCIDSGANPKNLTLTDINPEAIKYLETKFPISKIIHSDLFEKIKDKFDLIIFNPPYLPEDKNEPEDSKLATTGGKKGSEIINKFLKQAKNYLEKNGKIFLITSSLAEYVDFKELGYQAKEIDCEKLFFERLCVWELSI